MHRRPTLAAGRQYVVETLSMQYLCCIFAAHGTILWSAAYPSNETAADRKRGPILQSSFSHQTRWLARFGQPPRPPCCDYARQRLHSTPTRAYLWRHRNVAHRGQRVRVLFAQHPARRLERHSSISLSFRLPMCALRCGGLQRVRVGGATGRFEAAKSRQRMSLQGRQRQLG